MNYVPKLGGWTPDSQMLDASSHVDKTFADHIDLVEQQGQASQANAIETNGVLDLRPWCSPIEDQGRLGSCVGNGVVGALEFLQVRNGKPYTDLSRLFVYYNARLMVQEQDKDEGAYIRLAMGTLSSLGTCSEQKWPYDVAQVFIRPSWGSYREAFPNKIDSYYSIGGSGQTRIEFVKRALQAQHVVVFGMTVDQNYMSYAGGIVAVPNGVRQNSGGHCQVICGYDDNTKCWLVRNSWGTSWGMKGYAWVPFDYLDASDANDLWVPCLQGSNMDNG